MPLLLTPDERRSLETAARALLTIGPDADAWSAEAARLVMQLVGAERASLLLPGRPLVYADPDEFQRAAASAYTTYYRYVDAGQEERARRGLTLWTRRMVWDPDALRRSEYWGAFCVPYGIGDALGLAVDLPEGPAVLSLQGQRAFQDPDRILALLSLLRPAFEAGVRMVQHVASVSAEMASILDHVDTPVLVCDALTGRVVHANAALQRLLASDPERDAIRARMERFAGELARMPGYGAVPVLHDGGRRSTTVRTAAGEYRLAGGHVGRNLLGDRPTLLVSLARPEPAAPPVDASVQHLYQLTDREFEVARLLGERRSTEEIARLLNISPHTVRRHTEQVMAKLGVRSRREIPARLATPPTSQAGVPGA